MGLWRRILSQQWISETGMGVEKTVCWSCCPPYWYLICFPFPTATPSPSYPSLSTGPSVPSSSSAYFHFHSSQHSNLTIETLSLFSAPRFLQPKSSSLHHGTFPFSSNCLQLT